MDTQFARALYERVNVAGRLNTSLTSPHMHYARARLAGQRWHANESHAYRDYFEATGRVLSGMVLTAQRASLPLRVASATHWTHVLVHSTAQLAVGRGMAIHAVHPPTLNDVWGPHSGLLALEYLNEVFNEAAYHGVLGFAFEYIPLAAAAGAEQRGLHRLACACACVLAATVGRLALTIPRSVVALWAIMDAALFVVPAIGGLLALHAVATSLHQLLYVLPLSESPLSRQLCSALRGVSAARVGPLNLVSSPPRPDDLGQATDEGGPDSHSRVAARVNVAMNRFAQVSSDSEQDLRRACGVADGIIQDLRSYCESFETLDEFRGGCALLQTFMDLSYEEANWRAPHYGAAMPRGRNSPFANSPAIVLPMASDG